MIEINHKLNVIGISEKAVASYEMAPAGKAFAPSTHYLNVVGHEGKSIAWFDGSEENMRQILAHIRLAMQTETSTRLHRYTGKLNTEKKGGA